MNKDLLQCALGVHRFDKKIKSNPDCLLCSICKRADYSKDSDGYEFWRDFDEKGNEIHYRGLNGYESWREYDEKGNVIHYRNSYGRESWLGQ